MARRRTVAALSGWIAALAMMFAIPAAKTAEPVPLVFAAASLKGALDAAAADWRMTTGKEVRISYAGSSVLARQIERGAPADLFLAADLDWMIYLDVRGLVKPETKIDLLSNRLVLIAPKASDISLAIEPGFDLADALAGGRLAMADARAVPAGKYGKAALQKLGVWATVEKKVAQAENVRAALAFVSRGEAPLGVVYRTDALADPNVRIVATFPEATHPPIVYPAVLAATSQNADAAAFLAYLSSYRSRTIFHAHGFAVLNRS